VAQLFSLGDICAFMPEPYPKLIVQVETHRERYVRVFGTPESLRIFASSLSKAVESLPPSVSERQQVSDLYVADADGSTRETYLSFHAEPSLDYLAGRQKRYATKDFTVFLAGAVFFIFAAIGVYAFFHWIL
jgi:hypothetical protein